MIETGTSTNAVSEVIVSVTVISKMPL